MIIYDVDGEGGHMSVGGRGRNMLEHPHCGCGDCDEAPPPLLRSASIWFSVAVGPQREEIRTAFRGANRRLIAFHSALGGGGSTTRRTDADDGGTTGRWSEEFLYIT